MRRALIKQATCFSLTSRCTKSLFGNATILLGNFGIFRPFTAESNSIGMSSNPGHSLRRATVLACAATLSA